MKNRNRIISTALFFTTVICLPINAAIMLADVQVSGAGNFLPLTTGEQVFYDGTNGSLIFRWQSLPEVLTQNALRFWFSGYDANYTSATDYGMIDFEILSDGPVWMLVTTRFGGGGNTSGDWLPEVTTQAQLEADGWDLIASDITASLDGGTSDLNYLLYGRTCTAGQTFHLRTEKYHCPIPLMSIPEPATISIIILGGWTILRQRKTR